MPRSAQGRKPLAPKPAAPDLRERARRWLERLLTLGERARGEAPEKQNGPAADECRRA
jgi:hypothetical protein